MWIWKTVAKQLETYSGKCENRCSGFKRKLGRKFFIGSLFGMAMSSLFIDAFAALAAGGAVVAGQEGQMAKYVIAFEAK